MTDRFDTAAEPAADDLFQKRSKAQLFDLYAEHGSDLLYGLRGVLDQGPPPIKLFAPLSLTNDSLPMAGMIERQSKEAFSLLSDLPPMFAKPTRTTDFVSDDLSDRQSDPRLDSLLSIWSLMSGLYHPLPPDPKDSTLYLPLFDYRIPDAVAFTVSVGVAAQISAKSEMTATAKVKHIGLLGTYSKSTSAKVEVKDMTGRFQIVLSTRIRLRRYQGPMQDDIRYSARVIGVGGPTLFLPDERPDDYVTLVPRSPLINDAHFLTVKPSASETTEELDRKQGIAGNLGYTSEDETKSLGFEFKTETGSKLTISFLKEFAGALKRREYKDMEGLVDVYA